MELSVCIDLGYGFFEYEITDVQLGKVNTNTYSVTAPGNAVVYCNGKMISESYITEKGPVYDEIKFYVFKFIAPMRISPIIFKII